MGSCPAGAQKPLDLGVLLAEEACSLDFALALGFVALGLAALTMFAEQVGDDGFDGSRDGCVDDDVTPVALRFVGHSWVLSSQGLVRLGVGGLVRVGVCGAAGAADAGAAVHPPTGTLGVGRRVAFLAGRDRANRPSPAAASRSVVVVFTMAAPQVLAVLRWRSARAGARAVRQQGARTVWSRWSVHRRGRRGHRALGFRCASCGAESVAARARSSEGTAGLVQVRLDEVRTGAFALARVRL